MLRVVITVTGLIVPPLLIWALWILAVLSNVTAVQRIWQVWLESRSESAPDANPVLDTEARPVPDSDVRPIHDTRAPRATPETGPAR